jgi:hypothetical protein
MGLFRGIARAVGATRYMTSAFVMFIIVLYEMLAATGYVPHPAVLMGDLPGVTLYMLFSLLAVFIVSLLWYLWVLLPGVPLSVQLEWWRVYQQSDPAGLRTFNLSLLLLAAAGVLFSQSLFDDEHTRDTLFWLAVLLVLPILFDFSPSRRPRRVVVPQDGRTMNDLALHLLKAQRQLATPAVVIAALYAYNAERFSRQAPHCRDNPDERLPDGMVLDVPPDFR